MALPLLEGIDVVTRSHSSYVRGMKEFLIATIAAIFLVAGPVHAADTLQNLQGKKRPILLFAKSRSDAGLDKQVDLFRSYRPNLRERDIIVLSTTSREETRSAIGYTPINRGTARELKRRFSPSSSGLTVVLVGKDGSEKERWQRVVEPQEIFDLIDSIPKRQDEAKEQSQSG